MRRKLRWRVVAGVVVLVAVVFSAFDVLAITELRRHQVAQTDSGLVAALDFVKRPDRLHRLTARSQAGHPARQLSDFYVALVPAHSAPLVLLASPAAAPKLPQDLTVLDRGKTLRAADGHGTVRALAVRTGEGALLASTSMASVDSTVHQLRRILTVGSLIAIFVVALGVFLVVRRGLRPLETMAEEADALSATDLSAADLSAADLSAKGLSANGLGATGPPARVSSPRPGTEVGRLADALNGLLARVEAAVHEREASESRMRSFLADASHELRTPLASLLANAQLYRQGAIRSGPDVAEAMRRIELEAQRMGNLVDDMLRLARMDEGPALKTDLFDVSAVVADCVERARTSDGGRRWRTEVTPGLLLRGDEELLRRAVDNLLANVRAHTASGATVTAKRDGRDVVIVVSDDGAGVAADELGHIFERFYRSRSRRNGAGSGLGLAIVAEVANAHGGHARAALNEPHGLRVSLVLPAA